MSKNIQSHEPLSSNEIAEQLAQATTRVHKPWDRLPPREVEFVERPSSK